jgi:hypothetical protein
LRPEAAEPAFGAARVALGFSLLALGLAAATLRQAASGVGAEIDALLRERRELQRLHAERLAEVGAMRSPARLEAAVAQLGRPAGPE